MNVVENLESKSEKELIAEVSRILNEKEVDEDTQQHLDDWREKQKKGKSRISWREWMIAEIAAIRGVEAEMVGDFVGARTKLVYTCKHGEKTEMCLDSFAEGGSCSRGGKVGVCAGRRRMVTPLIVQAFSLREKDVEAGWLYEDGNAPIPYDCLVGKHDHKQSWKSFQNGYGCGKCYGNGYSVEEMTEIIREAFWKRSEWTIPEWWIYSGNDLDYIPFADNKGDDYFITWSTFRRGGKGSLHDGRASYVEYMTDFIRKAFAAEGRMVPWNWIYVDCSELIPYYCDKCGKKHQQSWNKFQNGRGCGKCHERNNPTLVYLYTLEKADRWVTDRIREKLDYSEASKAIAEAAINLMPQQELEALRDLLNARTSTQQTDHIVPISYFDLSDPQQIALANSIHNLRNIPANANWSRHNNLTTTEILRYFDNPQLREIYNAAAKKPQRLPQKDLPIDPEEWAAWREKRIKRGISQKDVEKFEKWHWRMAEADVQLVA